MSKTEWLGQFATKHKLMVGYHGHTNVNSPEAFAKPESWEKAMSYSKYNGINLDLGHFMAAKNTSPIPFLEKHADRVYARACEGSQDEQRAQRAVRSRRHADPMKFCNS